MRQAEILAAKRMIKRPLEHFDLYHERLIGGSAYGSAEMLNWLVHDRGIEPHIACIVPTAAAPESANAPSGETPPREPTMRQ